MASETVRIRAETHAKLRHLADECGKSMPEVLDQAVESLRRQRLLEAANDAYAKLKQDPRQWQAELEERALWEVTLADGQAKNT